MKKIQKILISSSLIACLSACSVMQEPNIKENLPTTLAKLYQQVPDVKTSDEFDTGQLDTTKWTYRNNKTRKGLALDPSYIEFANLNDDNAYISLKGKGKELKGVGISALHQTHYGFFETRWRARGFKKDVATSFHPGIWSFWGNDGKIKKGISGKGAYTMEIDLMEFSNWPHTHWSTDAPVFYNKKRIVATSSKAESDPDFDGDKAILIDPPNSARTDFDQWSILGMEYTPDYLQMWEQKNGEWQKVGRTVYFSDENTKGSIKKRHRNELYWIMSNLFIEFGGKKKDRSDTRLDIDYFRYYPMK